MIIANNNKCRNTNNCCCRGSNNSHLIFQCTDTFIGYTIPNIIWEVPSSFKKNTEKCLSLYDIEQIRQENILSCIFLNLEKCNDNLDMQNYDNIYNSSIALNSNHWERYSGSNSGKNWDTVGADQYKS